MIDVTAQLLERIFVETQRLCRMSTHFLAEHAERQGLVYNEAAVAEAQRDVVKTILAHTDSPAEIYAILAGALAAYIQDLHKKAVSERLKGAH